MAESESRLTVGVVAESRPGERRVAMVPKLVDRLARRGLRVVVEPGAGAGAQLADDAYVRAGGELGDAWAAEVVLKVAPPSETEVGQLKPGTVLIGFLDPRGAPEGVAALERAGVRAFAMEAVPRISRAQAMDALSSQSSVSGYRAVLLAAEKFTRFFPMLTTAAGTVPPAKVLVLGAGVAGLQALATAKRLGAQTTGYDVRPEVGEQVRSIGAKFLDLGIEAVGEGGYARELTGPERAEQQRRLTEAITKFDVVITTALVPGRRAPTLVTADAVKGMPAGGVVLDLAGESGGNCELSRPGEDVVEHDVLVSAPLNLPAGMPAHASELYARNVTELLELLVTTGGELKLDFSDEVVAGASVAGREGSAS
ncbi:Re/Si-specific NAD(P)(+) transhydrogenase subunit alpha [Amycolatopsis sp. PS_44_ISF1]|uniref:Re/Si-specific NAD(P)(+) transhydrogenase subunit alpha n=1 Tax=Amycolatopsis sp. PS_44_ISF1 TaxID=2974917 RepID=UPI0028DF515D|nr:Re/Si-specific NAD(P)(+) transhydrogenase subunit alpha [Amycolatopsis sp. PS_44_ISF1]MDT8915393.1 Re/Si-specific NAD(P)(+) transhydrogenase subunit alpha [Amycolatopsis sp. PS_44_ISF1]